MKKLSRCWLCGGSRSVVVYEGPLRAGVFDVGCGAGAFLDITVGVAARSVAIEPMKAYHPHLKRCFDAIYPDDAALAKGEAGKLDLVTAFAVVEHVTDPLSFLKNLRTSLAKGGQLVVTTPNRDEILMRVHADRFRPFFYRTAHLWYFHAASLEALGRRAGLNPVSTRTFHTYDLSNFALWLRDGRPTGQGKASEFGPVLDAAWRGYLEAQGWGDQILSVFKKP